MYAIYIKKCGHLRKSTDILKKKAAHLQCKPFWGMGVMDTFLKLATTTTLTLGLHLFGATIPMPVGDTNLLEKSSFSNLNQEMTVIAEYEPKDNGGPKSGEDAGSHFWQEINGNPA